jgi:hypothetical protein
MGTLINVSLDVTKITKGRLTPGKNGQMYLDLTLSIEDKTNDYGQNVSGWEAQSKEEREAKQNRNYLGNGKVVFTDGKVEVATKKEETKKAVSVEDDDDPDLPF